MIFFKKICLMLVSALVLSINPQIATVSHASDCIPAQDAILVSCDLSGANLREYNLSGVDLSNANLTGTSLYGANLTGANLTGANLTDANLTLANLTLANLTGANLTNADLTVATIRGIVLTGSTLTGITAPNLRNATLPVKLPENWVYRSGYLLGPGVNLSGATPPPLYGLKLQGANLENSNLSNNALCGSDLSGARLSGANLTKTRFISKGSGNNCMYSRFGVTQMHEDAKLLGVKSGGISQQTYLLRATFPAQWNLYGGYLVGPGADLRGANLEGVDLSEATLDGVISSSIIGTPVLPKLWRLVRGVLVGPPQFLARPIPSISGTRKVGSVLTANPGSWKPTPTKFQYEWTATCSGGGYGFLGSGKSVKLSSNYAGCTVTVTVTASKSGYQSGTTKSAATLAVGLGTFATKQVPLISGSQKVGGVLVAKCKNWSPSASVTYEWFANGVSLATGDTIRLLPTDVGKKITVRATGMADGYVTATSVSKSTAPIKLK